MPQDCAVDLAPYCHPRLAAVAVQVAKPIPVYIPITPDMSPKEAAQAYQALLDGFKPN